MENSNNNIGNVVGALLFGAIAGTVIGILFAPFKGSETRQKLSDGTKGLTDNFKAKLKEEAIALREKAEELDAMAKYKMNEMDATLKNKMDGVKNTI